MQIFHTDVTLFLDAAVAASALLLLSRYLSLNSTLRLPPGPTTIPILGSLISFRPKGVKRWETYAQWSSKWGYLTYMKILGQGVVIVNRRETAVELLDKRSELYSDRPPLHVAHLVGVGNIVPLYQYGSDFKSARRMMVGFMGSWSALERFHPTFERETSRLLKALLEDPQDLDLHIRRVFGATILPFLYGYHPSWRGEDPIILGGQRGMDVFTRVTEFGGFLADSVPLLKYLPQWLPGGGWKRLVKDFKEDFHRMADVPWDFTKAQIRNGTAEPSFVSAQFEAADNTPHAAKEYDIKWTATGIWSGAADTNPAALSSFFLAMMLYPEVQKKAQAEIDNVVGNERLPGMQDKKELIYLDAIWKEMLRWNPVAPLAFPHVARRDDIIDGYAIPKGTVIIANVWDMFHDPEEYLNPSVFNPDRFITTSTHKAERDPAELAFGFGRRSCPGMKVAHLISFLTMAKVLSVFDICKPVDEQGHPIEPVVDYIDGTISRPEPYRCAFKPRSEKVISLIKDMNFGDD